jgi:predicted DNA-binding transcriptional regulator YafY
MQRLERLYAITEAINRRAPAPASASWLAKQFGVSRRTIERDLDALRDAGVALYADHGRTGGHHRLDAPSATVFTLSVAEVTALLVAVSVAGDMPFADAAVSASQRLLDSLSPTTRINVDHVRARFRTAKPQVTTRNRVRRSVEEAVRRHVVVNLLYRDEQGAETDRAVEAVGFFKGNDDWFLIGWCRLRKAGRIFRLDRIQTARLTRQSFAPRDVDDTLGWVPMPVEIP